MAAGDGRRLELSDLGRRGIVLSTKRKERRKSAALSLRSLSVPFMVSRINAKVRFSHDAAQLLFNIKKDALLIRASCIRVQCIYIRDVKSQICINVLF